MIDLSQVDYNKALKTLSVNNSSGALRSLFLEGRFADFEA